MVQKSELWFEKPDADGTMTAWIMDDLSVHIGEKDSVAIAGPAGARIVIDIDDAADLAVVLNEAVAMLRLRDASLTTKPATGTAKHPDSPA